MTSTFKTFLKHTAKDFHNQSVNPPVDRASTIIFKSMQDIRKTQSKFRKNPIGGHFDYGRQGTSTTYILQKILTKLEESYHVFLTPTGFGAIFLAIFSLVRPGDEILVSDPSYKPTRRFTEDFLKDFNIKTIFYNPNDLDTLRNNISKNPHNLERIIEKYKNLAKEALSSGDKILHENYLQHSDHFSRILTELGSNKIKETFKDKADNKEEQNIANEQS